MQPLASCRRALRQARGAITTAVVAAILFGAGPAVVHAAPAAAGAVIRNMATATYIPGGYAQSETVSSNAVLANVQAVEALALTQSQSVMRGPATAVTLTHLLANTGNTPSGYAFTLVNAGPGCTAQTFALSDLRVVRDQNNNGVLDAADPAIVLGTASALTLQPGEMANLLVQGTTPNIPAGTGCVAFSATTSLQRATAVNNDVVTLGNNAVLSLSKSASYPGLVVPGATRIVFTIVGTSIGAQDVRPASTAAPLATPITVNGAATPLVLISDVMPAGTAYDPNSLQTTAAGAVRLHRLAGDAARAYRTGDGGVAAIEVAIGLPTPLTRNSAMSMTFAVRAAASLTKNVVNTSQGYFDDGTGAVEASSNTVVIASTPATLGLAMSAGLTRANADAAGRPDGTSNVHFSVRLKNYGVLPLNDVQVTDVLEGAGATQFGSYSSQPLPGAGQYTVVAGSIAMAGGKGSAVAGIVAAANPAFTGQAAGQNLLAAGATLPPGAEVTVVFELRIHLAGRTGTLLNTARAAAALAAGAAATQFDDSSDGVDPDPDGDGNPANNSVPTPVATAAPLLTLDKSSSAPRWVSEGVYDLDYAFTVSNAGNAAAPNVRVIDNLQCAFEMDSASGRVASWALVGKLTVLRSLLRPATSFTGVATCDRSGQASANALASVPYEAVLSLTDGTRALLPGESETLSLTVRITVKPQYVGSRTLVVNKAWAASFMANAINLDPSMVVAAAMASTRSVLIDPMGVVYNSVTRQPIAGAVVTVRRTACAASAAGAIAPAEIVGSGTPGAYTFHPDGSLSMTTGADGIYQFFLQSPPVTDVCTYAISVAPPAGSGYVVPSTMIPVQPGTFSTCGAVAPKATAPQGSDPTAYFFNVRGGIDGTGAICEVLHNHIPLDPGSLTGLLLKKEGSKATIEFGDFMDYALTVTNKTGVPIAGVDFSDTLPPGLAYIRGSARLNGQRAADPAGGAGPALMFSYPTLPLGVGASAVVRYRIRVGVGAPTEGDAINRASARSGPYVSNPATFKVRISGGVFSDDAYAFGKVYLDCKRDGVQSGEEETGIPGVRIYMENGTSVITDSEGKWSLYGIKPVTHVLRLDASTLPADARAEVLDNRNAGDPLSRFLDVKKGEFVKANFIIGNCDAASVVDEVKARRAALPGRPEAEGEALATQRLDPQGKRTAIGDVRGLSATGQSSALGATGSPVAVAAPLIQMPAGAAGAAAGNGSAAGSSFVNATPGAFAGFSGTSALAAAPGSLVPLPVIPAVAPRSEAPALVDLEALMPTLDNQPGFIGLKDGDNVAAQAINVRVKGIAGSVLRLSVNTEGVEDRRIGKRAVLPGKQLMAWEYIGVVLRPGANVLKLEALDSMGILRATQEIRVMAPDKLGLIQIDLPELARADQRTPVVVTVRLTDAGGVPVTARTPLTLEADRGRWLDEDLNTLEPGTQVFMEGGSAEFRLIPPGEPGDARVRVSAGGLVKEVRLALLPEIRPMLGVGIVEGVLDFSKRGKLALGAPGAGSAFEAELSGLSSESADQRASARTAFFFKGTVKGDYLLTTAYDSDKTTRERLFRDIRPDEFYPVYGDASVKGFDAQSTQKLYVRIDRNRSYLLYGDFTTASSTEVRQLSQSNRSLTGLKHVHDDDRVRTTSYAARTDQTQQVEEFRALGTSGPYFLSAGSGEMVVNSEQVEILVRDRNQPNTVLQRIPMARFSDYTIEPLTRRILFTRAISSVDGNLDPQSIRVTYEVESGGPKFTVAGTDVQVRLGDSVQLGVVASTDGNPDNKRKLSAVTALARLGESTTVAAEFVRTESDDKGAGTASRIEVRHQAEQLAVVGQLSKSALSFDNPGATISPGHTEGATRAEYKIDDTTTLRGEALYGKDTTTEARKGYSASVQKKLSPTLAVEAGIRHGAHGSSSASFDYGQTSTYNGVSGGNVGAAPVTSLGAAAATAASADIEEITTVRARITTQVPGLPQAQVFVEAEQDVKHSDGRVLAIGGNYAVTDKTRIYGRYEVISSLTGPYELDPTQSNNTGILGVESAYMEGGRVFNEYRLADAADGRSVQAAMGIRNTVKVAEGLRLTGGIERTKSLGGYGNSGNTGTGYQGGAGNVGASTAVVLGAEYLTERLKASGVAEARDGSDAKTYLVSAGLGYKLDAAWTLLARSIVSNSEGGGGDTGNSRLLARQQLGMAWRPVDQDVWNALARYEHRTERVSGNGAPAGAPMAIDATGQPGTTSADIVSVSVNFNPERGTQVTGRYAAKVSRADDGELASTYRAHLLHGRYTRDLNADWDIGVQAGLLAGSGGARQRTLGFEVGYQAVRNMWISAGYNVLGLRDRDLAGADYTSKGAYVRLRFKFDENTLGLGSGTGNSDGNGNAAPAGAPVAGVDETAAVRAVLAGTPARAAWQPGQALPDRLAWSEERLFVPATAEFTSAGRVLVQALAAQLGEGRIGGVAISVGHGDLDATHDALWLARAAALRNVLLAQGPREIRISVDSQPPAPMSAADPPAPASGGGRHLQLAVLSYLGER